eukprot:scaffold18569_cov71-Phaeocystis_antarctica.AAC.4
MAQQVGQPPQQPQAAPQQHCPSEWASVTGLRSSSTSTTSARLRGDASKRRRWPPGASELAHLFDTLLQLLRCISSDMQPVAACAMA